MIRFNRPCPHQAVAIFLLAVASAMTALAGPPRVVSTTPADGNYDVDPASAEIRVEFDQDMSRDGHSVCGGGDWFPRILGKPGWESARVFVMRVELTPDHDYGFNINCSSAMNFRSVAGESAVPYSLNFATRGGVSDVPPEKNAASFKMLRRLIDDEYSYRDVCGVDWPASFGEFEQRMSNADTPQQFGRYAGRLLARAEDVHVSVKLGDRWFASFRRDVPPNANPQNLPAVVPNFKKLSQAVCSGRFDDGVGYILINTWNADRKQAIEQAYAALEEFKDNPGLIVDVRFNSGGDEMLAREFAGCFVDEPVLYAKHVLRDKNAPGGFGPPYERILQPSANRPKYRGKVAVLTGPHVMSSCEAFLLMMKTAPNCKLVGAASYGASGNPQPHKLPNGVVVNLPSWKAMTSDGETFEKRGVPPDIKVDARPEDFKTRDPVIEAALKHLR